MWLITGHNLQPCCSLELNADGIATSAHFHPFDYLSDATFLNYSPIQLEKILSYRDKTAACGCGSEAISGLLAIEVLTIHELLSLFARPRIEGQNKLGGVV